MANSRDRVGLTGRDKDVTNGAVRSIEVQVLAIRDIISSHQLAVGVRMLRLIEDVE